MILVLETETYTISHWRQMYVYLFTLAWCLVDVNVVVFNKKITFTKSTMLQDVLQSFQAHLASVAVHFSKSSMLSWHTVPGKQHRRVTSSRWPDMLQSIGAQTPQRLPAVDYGVGRTAEWNREWGQLDKDRPANYTQVMYTCSGAPILKLTLSVLKHAEVTIALQWSTADWNSALPLL